MKIASIESLEFLLSPTRNKYYAVSLRDSSLETLVKNNYPSDQILTPELLTKKTQEERLVFASWAIEKDVLQQTNLPRLMRQYNIGALLPDTHSSEYVEKWGKKNNVRIFCTLHRLQKRFENKLYFDRFLHKHHLPVPKSRILKSLADAKHIETFPVVLQTPDSMRSEGTFVIRSRDELMRFLVVDKKADFPLLCRQYIDHGIPVGVSILLGPKKMVFSAIRMQAHFSLKDGKSVYYGIQWLKTSMLHPKAVKGLNESLLKAGREMQKKGFLGIAAFDLIIRGEEIFFLECNPRIGTSSPQMSFKPELIQGVNLAEEYVRVMSGKDLSVHKPFIPASNYEGFGLDMSFLASFLPIGLELNPVKSGIYSYKPGHLSFLSAKVDDFSKVSSMFIHYIRPQRSLLNSHLFMFVFTHFPLLKITGNHYEFLEEAKKLLKLLEDILIKK